MARVSVNTLVQESQTAGYKSVIWNGTDTNGKSVSAGIYLYQIQAGEYLQTKKMVLLK
jgi:flagellar hook assembly protein FlgD